jgi:mono/diheme cytochrome c family protein
LISTTAKFCPACLLACAGGLLLLSIGYLEVWPALQRKQWANEVEIGKNFYAQNCATCHGTNLEGQPDWQKRKADGKLPAPPHDDTGHTWHHSDDQIFKITKLGVSAVVPGYKSDMLGFAGKLSDAQIRAIIVYIKSKWSEPHRKYQDERNQFQQ